VLGKRSHRGWLFVTLGSLAVVAGCTWGPDRPKPDGSASAGASSAFFDYQAPRHGVFGARSVWKANISRAPTAPNSRALVANLTRQVTSYYGGVAAFNAFRYNSSFYSVAKNQQLSTVKWDDCQGKRVAPAGLFGAGGQFVNAPIPDRAVPASGTDGSLTVYQAATDTMWDFWRARKAADGWHACWGGRMDRVSASPGYFTNGFGTTATGLSSIGGVVGIREAKAGRIDHALTLQIPKPAVWSKVSWPAQRSDGHDTAPDAIPEGTRLRLNPKIDVAKLRLHPVAAAIARAAQTYGFIVTDKAGSVSVVAESGNATRAATGTDPWIALLRGTPDYAVLKGFPWQHLQALPQHYGRS
jgi:hypothetical protein